ncbi:MAG: GNAT family N-acetyltransferase/peptidase C39 family protein [Candidatus Zixiibacteriota bacterium]|nr:MAG: GNAT family N-acetyltransferase/peptidase C39 family protein [candidate division Zixibacteria bacterium]
MGSRIRIRPATEYDLPVLVYLEQVAFETDRFTKDQLEYLLTRSRATTFVLEHGSAVVGAACVLWRKERKLARLYNLAVDRAFRGKGYGDRLLRECELESARRECDRITLEVRQDNETAIRFYEKHGYEGIRNLPDYYSDGMAGLKMAKKVRRKVSSKLRLDIPYHAQTLDFTCGPASVMMTLKHFFPEIELTRALEMSLWKEATMIFMASGFGGTDGYGLALSLLNRGLSCRLIMSMDTTPMLKSVRIQKKREVMKVVHNDLKRKARRAGVTSATYEYGIDEIISALHRGMVPIAMISTYRLTGDRVPHWVVVTGFDRDHVYIHDPDIASYRKNRSRARHLKVEKSEFLQMTRYGKEVYRCLLLAGPGHNSSKAYRK